MNLLIINLLSVCDMCIPQILNSLLQCGQNTAAISPSSIITSVVFEQLP